MASTCSIDGCARPHRARGLCGTHYNRAHQPNRHAARVTVECAGCGIVVEKRPHPQRPRRYCSLTCRTATQYREVRASRPGTELVHVGPAWPHSELPARHPARQARRQPGIFTAGSCGWCGDWFTVAGRSTARYCSRRCWRKAAKARHERRFLVSPVVRLSIYERDGWICQLCFDPVDPNLPTSDEWAATLDHIVCQSWTDEPDHSAENLRLAHRWCNSVRGAEQHYTAADLVA